MSEDYTPISCALYSEYELAILRRRMVRMAWRDEGGVCHVEKLSPRDLRTQTGVEYLIAYNATGAQHIIRLDRILKFDPLEAER